MKQEQPSTTKQQLEKVIHIICSVFALTILAGLVYTIYLNKTLSSSETIVIPFAFIAVTGLGLFTACIILALIFYEHISSIKIILLPVFLITSPVPIYFLYKWYANLPVKVPVAGQLPVSVEQYHSHNKLILEDFLKTELDSNQIDIYQDTIISVQIDTIIYFNKTKFFAIIIAVAKDGPKLKYCAAYRVGRNKLNNWELGIPKGNTWKVCFPSIAKFKKELRQYYYKRYSINGSSNKSEILKDEYIFNFTRYYE